MKKINDCLECIGSGLCIVNGTEIRRSTEGIRFENIIFDQFITWDNESGLRIADEQIETLEIEKKLIDKTDEIIIKDVRRIIFRNCEFTYLPTIDHENIWYIEFDNCTFSESGFNWTKHLLIQSSESKKIYFKDCKFESFHIGDISDIKYNRNIELCWFQLTGGEIEDLTIENIEIASKFYINKQYDGNTKQTKVGNLVINNSIFKENFKLHNCDVLKSSIKDSDFEKHSDFYKSTFHSGTGEDDHTIYFKALNFKGLALFGDCKFYEKVVFQYITFEGYCHFRRAFFGKGLDLDYANIQQEMNFFGSTGLESKESKRNTSQETYRIIKHNFDKLGNRIEANKYHSLELDTKRRNIFSQVGGKFQKAEEFLIYYVHWLFSNHSKSWAIPLFWIIIVSLVIDCLHNIPYDAYGSLCQYIQYCFDYIVVCREYNPKYLSILTNINIDEYPKIFLFHKLSLGYLYYQFLLAVRKDTKK